MGGVCALFYTHTLPPEREVGGVKFDQMVRICSWNRIIVIMLNLLCSNISMLAFYTYL